MRPCNNSNKRLTQQPQGRQGIYVVKLKKWHFFVFAIFAVLAVTVSLFAYEYVTAPRQRGGVPSSDWATVVEEAPGPIWSVVWNESIGDVPSGKLFRVMPRADFNGDLSIRIYLTNTGALSKAYKYLNMKLYVENSIEARGMPSYQVLALENGVVTFHVEGCVGEVHYVSVIGGSYGLVSGNFSMWEADWAIMPEFYCEVSPR